MSCAFDTSSARALKWAKNWGTSSRLNGRLRRSSQCAWRMTLLMVPGSFLKRVGVQVPDLAVMIAESCQFGFHRLLVPFIDVMARLDLKS